MKNVLLTILIAGGVVAALLYYADYKDSPEGELDDVADAANDAYKTMNRNIRKAENSLSNIVDPALG